MLNLVMVGLGGTIGTLLRYGLNHFIYSLFNSPLFPYGTLIINILGCFVIGLFAGLADSRLLIASELRGFVQIGILGGFTTFSAFGYETFTLIQGGQFMLSLINVLLQVGVGLAAVWIGYYLA
jgi:CrcB protein